MATYKVIQDIEAEDKLLGPLSLRQFIYAVIVFVLLFIMWRLFTVQPLLVLPLLPPTIFFAVLAAPFGHDQSSEVWLLAKIRFFLKPRVRIWDQSGLQELVTITVPKKIERVLTNGLDEFQVKSRLEALAQTIDTRGWAVKGVDVNLYTNPAYASNDSSDRLIPTPAAAVAVTDVSLTATDDMLDTANPVAQHLDQLVRQSDQAHRQQIAQQMQQVRDTPAQQIPAQPLPTPVPPQQSYSMPVPTPQFTPQITAADEQALLTKIHAEDNQDLAYGHTRVLQTEEQKKQQQKPASTVVPPVTAKTDPAILNLANNDDLSVATIARQINKKDQPGDDEVVISLR